MGSNHGCPDKQGKASAHGEPLGDDNIRATKEFLGFPSMEAFHVPAEVKEYFKCFNVKCSTLEEKWNKMMESYKDAYPELFEEWNLWQSGQVPEGRMFEDDFWKAASKPNATRISSSEVLNSMANIIPNLIGGSADLAPSNKTIMKGRGDFSAEDRSGSNFRII